LALMSFTVANGMSLLLNWLTFGFRPGVISCDRKPPIGTADEEPPKTKNKSTR